MTIKRENSKPSVFLSYSAQDALEARKLEQDLALSGIDVWSDRQLRAGDRWEQVITEALGSAEVILVLVTPSSLRSQWVTREWQTALISSKRVIPVLAGGVKITDLPQDLAKHQVTFLGEDNQTAIQGLVANIKSWSESTEPLPAQRVDVQKIIDDTLNRTLERLGLDTRRQSTSKIKADYIFVVISYDPAMDPTFDAIQSAARRVGMRAERVKDIKRDFPVTEKILEQIDSARLVVVDLTRERPNVYFELGYARGKGKTVVTLLKEGSKAHVDVRGWNYLEYIDSRPLEEDLVERFKVELQED
ncbi:TIR domain-containing protein [Streptomyces sp. NBC_01167]|uniref:TIR domain-containing protein n=1 Tax=Streptomyces sp. NBC_01167 TaxID=2903756 RepID=UPI0038666A8B|nr:TIR domain-containing protein [Streptomyces sp. NBC_01167]